MGLARGSVVLVKTKTVTHEGWVFSDDYEQDLDFEGKTLVMKVKSGKLTLKWTDIRLVILQWDASDKSYNNTDYLGTEIKGGYAGRTYKSARTPRGERQTQEEWDKSYREWFANRDVDAERMKARNDLIKLMEEMDKEHAATIALRDNVSMLTIGGGGALIVVWWLDPKGYEWLMWGTVPWAYAFMKSGELWDRSMDEFVEWFDKRLDMYDMDVKDLYSDTAF